MNRERDAILAKRGAVEAAQRAEADAARAAAFREAVNALEQRVAAGLEAFLYESVYVAVDSDHNGERLADGFDITALQGMGSRGWEVVGVAPRTVATALENISIGSTMGKTWGGGIGGSVAGVHVLLRLRVTPANLTDARAALAAQYRVSEG